MVGGIPGGRVTGRKLLSLTLGLAVLVVAHERGLIADVPLAALLAAVVGSALVCELAARALPPGGSQRDIHLRIGIQVLSVTVPIYLTGWGPMLMTGYLYIVVDAFRKDGSRARTPLLVWLTVSVAAGQVAIALDVVPTLIPESVVHGLSALVLLGLLSGVDFLGSVSRSREAEEAARRASEARMAALVLHSSDTITIIGADNTVRYASPSIEQLIGRTPTEMLTIVGREMVHSDDRHLAAAMRRRVDERPGEPVQGELRLVARDGRAVPVDFIATNLMHDPAVEGIVVNIRDISDRVSPARQGLDQSARDAVTGLPSRAFFDTRLRAAAERAGMTLDRSAVVVVDIDRFDRVNTTAGPSIGDALLKAVAERIEGCVRPGDLAARIGDDEFAVLIARVLGGDDAVSVAARIASALRDPFVVAAHDFSLTCSAGISLVQPGLVAEDALRQAQLAMRSAKRRGGDTHEIFDPRLAAPARRRLDLETELVRAVERGQFVLHYQPVVDLHDESIAGFEALVRWNHPHHGLIAPAEFIHLAEQSGAIDVLGHWVLEEACRSAGAWTNDHSLDVHVNLSVHQLLNPALADRISSALHAGHLAPERLVLEITETALMKDVDASVTAIDSVRETGVRFAIDDFGVGYSSFAYLTRLPVQVLKLDHSLIDSLASKVEALAVIETIVALAHRLGMAAVAEGVERDDQLGLLRNTDCDLFQGFCFGRPVPEREAAALIG